MRNQQINFRVTPEEKEQLVSKAKKSRMSLSDYILALSKNKKIYVIEDISDFIQYFGLAINELHNVRNQIIKVGVNINQIAYIANSTKNITATELKYANINTTEVMEYAKRVLELETALIAIVKDITTKLDKVK